MLSHRLKGFCFLMVCIFFYGCASKGIHVRSYVEAKPRVDQNLNGNAGFVDGQPQPTPPVKPTRQVIVVEVTKETKEEMDNAAPVPNKPVERPVVSGLSPAMDTPDTAAEEPDTDNVVSTTANAPSPGMQPNDNQMRTAPAVAATGYTEYKVEKDDTLQKISKKFYDSYSKWIKIYEANKDVIKNPDRIKPGITIKIPNL